MLTTDYGRTRAVRTSAIVAAFVVPVVAAAFALILVHNGPASCDPVAIRFRGGMCLVPTDPPGAPSTVALVPPTVEHHTAERIVIIGVGIVISVVLLALVARFRSDDGA